jgi:eukaryotic-like serine/threonine-protein kinase
VIGEIVGSYKIESKLGQGGMGVVYVAQHPLLKKKAVVKFLHAELSSDGELVDRFFNEARSATMIRHPGIVDVFDFGHHASGCAYILMEFLHGQALSDRIKQDGPFEASFAIAIGKQLASALAAAHEQGIVHRDLKPDNVYLVPDREAPGGTRVKVLDFGIAKLANEASGAVKTQAGVVMGTPTYMAPEQCRSAGEVDHRADIYALGCILFEMVCGRPPFRCASLGQLIAAHMFEPPPLPSSFGPVPADLEAVILRALEKEPDDRQGSMSNLSVELASCDGATPTPVPRRRSQPIVTPATLDATAAPIAPSTAPLVTAPALTTLGKSTGQLSMPAIEPRSRRWMAISAGVVALAGAAVAWKLAASEEATPVAATPAPQAPATQTVIVERPAAPPKPILLTLDSDPSGAEVIQEHDGMRLGKTPFDKSLAPVAGGTLVYVLRLEGYEDHRVSLAADRDNREKVALKATPKKPPPISSGRPRPPTTPPPPPFTPPSGPTSDGMLRPKI